MPPRSHYFDQFGVDQHSIHPLFLICSCSKLTWQENRAATQCVFGISHYITIDKEMWDKDREHQHPSGDTSPLHICKQKPKMGWQISSGCFPPGHSERDHLSQQMKAGMTAVLHWKSLKTGDVFQSWLPQQLSTLLSRPADSGMSQSRMCLPCSGVWHAKTA